MNKKNKPHIVYSTNPSWTPEMEEDDEEITSLSQHKLRIRLETKQRGGKKATIIGGFRGSEAELETLAKILKTKLGRNKIHV
jgi:translation initiation factor 1